MLMQNSGGTNKEYYGIMDMYWLYNFAKSQPQTDSVLGASLETVSLPFWYLVFSSHPKMVLDCFN